MCTTSLLTSLLPSIAGVVAAFSLFGAAASAQTLKSAKERGELVCGVSQGIAGFSIADDKGAWTGFDVDICRAVAAATLGDPGKVRFVPLSAAERFQALRDRKVDLLARNSTWTLSRETEFGLVFTNVNFYDGQGFMTPKAGKATSALELDGAKICVQAGTTTRANVVDYFAANSMKLELVDVNSPAEALKAYEEGRCAAMSSDVSQLHAERLRLAKPNEHVILVDVISKEPLGSAVRNDDPQWAAIVKWTVFALLQAEELGVSSKTIDDAMKSAKPDVRWLVGVEGALGEGLGLGKEWAATMIRRVGNYAEIYDRNVGPGSKLDIPRGLNQLWSNGGILYAPPVR